MSNNVGLLGVWWEGRLSLSCSVVEVPALTNSASAVPPVKVAEIVADHSDAVELRCQAHARVVTDVVGLSSAPLRPESVWSFASLVSSGIHLLAVVESVLKGTEGELWLSHGSDGLGSEVPHPLASNNVRVEEVQVDLQVLGSVSVSDDVLESDHQWGESSLGVRFDSAHNGEWSSVLDLSWSLPSISRWEGPGSDHTASAVLEVPRVLVVAQGRLDLASLEGESLVSVVEWSHDEWSALLAWVSVVFTEDVSAVPD